MFLLLIIEIKLRISTIKLFVYLKLNTTVTGSQNKFIIEKCSHWQEQLVFYRKKLNKLRTALYLFAHGKTDNTVLTTIEHFYNQFHIQIINMHDLKYEIRGHLQEAEKYFNIGHRIPHHYKKDKVDLQLAAVDKLEQEFQHFIQT